MKDNQVSDTAIKTACWRAYHSQSDNPEIFNDFLAYDLVGEAGFESFKTMYVSILLYFGNRPDNCYACENAHLACAVVK